MTDVNLLSDAMSPYLRAHAGNPVPWRPWGEEAFVEAARRDVPVFLSIGYATCHWCHVMARESFSDAGVASFLAERFVSVKVDREEHPDVDSAYMAQASAFTHELGWPLSVFLTPDGVAFHAGTYFPPEPVAGRASFRQVLEAVTEAWTDRRADVEAGAARIAEAVRAAAVPASAAADLSRAAALLARAEDPEHGGFGTGQKFPCAPALGFLRTAGSRELVQRTLERMSASPLRDPVDGGFFRYATRRDWSEPHYERMLYDNALLLGLLLDAVVDGAGAWARDAARGVARFLSDVLQLPAGGYASAQDSESTIDGVRSEGGYYRSGEREELDPPALDEKVLSGWNGLAIEAMARAGFVLGDARCTESARWAADYVLENHLEGGVLWRASTAERRSEVRGTLEDHGMLASGLLVLGSLTGEAAYVRAATDVLDAVRAPEGFRGPGDAVLAARGLAVEADPSEGAHPSGLSACARASRLLHLLTADASRLADARRALALLAGRAEENPIALGAALDELAHLARAPRQLVVLLPEGAAVPDAVRTRDADAIVVATDAEARELAAAGVELLEGRACLDGAVTVYACEDFACRLPETIAP